MITISKDNFFLIAGPCAIEREETTIHIARTIKAICLKLGIPFIFKASYKKANRTRLDSFSGIGDIKALNILQKVKEDLEIPVTTDVHEIKDIDLVRSIVDVIQIPAFLCRQTDLLVAAAETGLIVNIKKGQFLSPEGMEFAAEKVIKNSGPDKVWLTERGNSFGYGDLIVDFKNIPILRSFNCPVILDCTHSLQRPNNTSGITGGFPQFIETIAKAGIAAGVDGIFIETHPEPKSAKSDGANMLHLNQLEPLLIKLQKIKKALD